MIERLLSNELMDLVQKSLDATALQHRAISNNLANVDTPGFKRAEVVFQEKLKMALEAQSTAGTEFRAARTNEKHVEFSERLRPQDVMPQIEIQNNTSLRNDQNNVDIDIEMSKLAQNQLAYQTLAQIAQARFAELRTAINEGRR